jgi:hypothetical protein
VPGSASAAAVNRPLPSGSSVSIRDVVPPPRESRTRVAFGAQTLNRTEPSGKTVAPRERVQGAGDVNAGGGAAHSGCG